MAGTHAGQSFNTYPLMNGKIIPEDYFLSDLGIFNIFENTIAINFNHRWLGTFTFIYTLSLFLYFLFSNFWKIPKFIITIVILTLIFQFFLGILALLSNVYIAYASMHQTNSVILLSTLLISYHQFKYKKYN